MGTVDYLKNENNWVGYFLTHAIDATKAQGMSIDPENLDVQLKINGVEFDFVSVVEHIGKEFENSVKKAANEMLMKKLDIQLFENLSNISDLAESLRQEMTVQVDKLHDCANIKGVWMVYALHGDGSIDVRKFFLTEEKAQKYVDDEDSSLIIEEIEID